MPECLNKRILYNMSGLMYRWHEAHVSSDEQLADAKPMRLPMT